MQARGIGLKVLARDVPDARREPWQAVKHQRSLKLEALLRPRRGYDGCRCAGNRLVQSHLVQFEVAELEICREESECSSKTCP